MQRTWPLRRFHGCARQASHQQHRAQRLEPNRSLQKQPRLLQQPKAVPWAGALHHILRDSYSDLSFFDTSTCATDLSKVKGATFSWSYDGIAKNNQWLAEGVAGARFLYLEQTPGTGEPYVNYIAIAPLVQFQRVTNSSPKQAKSNIDVLSPGVSSEAFIDQLTPNSQMYLGLRGNANGDFEGNVHSWSGTAEIQPFIYP